jgi:hypothetical protein
MPFSSSNVSPGMSYFVVNGSARALLGGAILDSPNGLVPSDCSEFGKSCIMQASGYVRCL